MPHDDVLDRDRLGAFVRHTHAFLRGSFAGPLAGLTFGLKDIFDVAGCRTGFGSPDWLATHSAATATSSTVRRLLEAGATMVGKTHTEEMAFSLTGENAHYGTPINPAAPTRVPGGSSSGSAAAVAGGLVDFAIGSDTGGSVRGPASFTGVYGIRPTHGRIPLDGVLPLAPMFDTCGWFAGDAVLLARVGEVLLPPCTDDRIALPSLAATPRLLLADDAFAYALPSTAAALAPAVRHVEALLGAAQRVNVSNDGLHAWFDVFRVLQYVDIWRTHRDWITRVQPSFGAQVAARFAAVAAADANEAKRMAARRVDIQGQLATLLAGNAILLLPTMPDIAPLRGASPADTVMFRERALGLLSIAGLGGLPQVTLPLATLHGCPLGLSMIAAPGHDEILLQIARAL